MRYFGPELPARPFILAVAEFSLIAVREAKPYRCGKTFGIKYGE